MPPTNPSAQSSTSFAAGGLVQDPAAARDEEDVALGWECALPALQIDVWHEEAAAEAAN